MSLGRAGVAIGTVSNVLNNPDLVSENTRLKVEAAIAELGFVRNSAARALAARRTDTVGLVLTDIGNSLFVDIARGAESAASEAQLKLLLANSDSRTSKQNSYLELFDEARVAGVILAPKDGPLDSALAVQSHGRSVVLVNTPVDEPRLCCVMVTRSWAAISQPATFSIKEGGDSSTLRVFSSSMPSPVAWTASRRR
jgi:LacI family transcriptional regulator